jgi:hypothetical protein
VSFAFVTNLPEIQKMTETGERRTIVFHPAAEAAWRLNGESGDCVLKVKDGSHRFGYRDADGTWYEDGGGPLDVVEFGLL